MPIGVITLGGAMGNVLQRRVARRYFNYEIAERQKLYSDFISEGTRLHADAMTNSTFDLNELVNLYVGTILLPKNA
jgi:hypothetical protein